MIFKQETIKSWFTGINSSINNEVVKPFQNAEQVIWKYNQAIEHNSLTQNGWNRILAQSDDSLKMYLTSIKGTTASMTGYTTSLQGNITGFKKVSSAITQYNSIASTGTANQITFANAVSATNAKLGTYLTGLNGAKASLGGYVLSLIGATAKTIALQFATIALNSAITMGASLIISGIVSAISSWIHKTENMISASEVALNTIKSLNDELKNNQKTISETAKRFAELSQGVDQLTGKNISLTSDDYEEFLSLSNQLAEMFPTLTRNYNDNGDAIIQLSGDVDTIVGSLHNLIEAQKELTNRQIAEELPTIFDGLSSKSNAYEKQLLDLESKKDALVKSLGDVQSDDFTNNFMSGFSNKWIEIAGDNLEIISQIRDDYIKILTDANIDFEELTPDYEVKNGVEIPVGFTIKINSSDEDIEKTKLTIDGKIEELAKQYETDIQKLNEEIKVTNDKNKANWNNLSNSIFAWLSTDDSFKVMDDAMQATVQNIVNSLDWSSLDFSSWEDAEQYIQDNILSLFNTTKGKQILADIQVMLGVKTQFNNGDISVNEYQDEIQELLENIEGLPEETKKSIMWLFGINFNEDGTTTSDTDTLVNNVKEKLQDDFDDKVGELTLEELQIAAEQVEVPEGTLLSWDELKAKIKEVQSSTSNFENPISSTTDILSQVELLSKGLNQLDKIYADVYDKGDFNWSSILNSDEFKQTFGELGQVYDDFIETISNSPNDISACQSAFNNLASSYIYNSGVLDNLTEETKASTVAMLEQMGVANAEEVVTKALAIQTDYLAVSKEFAASKGKELAEATWEEVSAFMDEAQYSDEARVELAELALAKMTCNGTALDFSGDIQNLIGYIEILGGATNALKLLNAAKSGDYSSLYDSNGKLKTGYTSMGGGKENHDALVKLAEKEVQNALNSASNYSVSPNFTGGSTTQKAINDAAKSAKDAAKATKDAADTVKEAVAETFDFIENGIDLFEKNLSKLEDKANNTGKSFKSRAQAYEEALKGVSFGMELLSDDYNKYMAKANSIGLDESIAQKIRGGDSNIWDYTDDNLKQQIKDYETWYKKAQGCLDKIEELKQKQVELSQQSIELIITQYEKYSTKVENANNRMEKWISLKEAWGFSGNTDNYNSMNKNIQKQIGYVLQQDELLKKLQKTVTKGSEAWYEYNERIDANKSTLYELKQQMVENAKAAAELAKATADKKADKYSQKNELYDAKIDNAISVKKKNSFIDKKISNINNTQSAYNDAVATDTTNLKKAKKTLNNFKSTKENKSILSEIKKKIKAGKRITQSLLKKASKLDDNGKLYKACLEYNAYFDAKEADKQIAELYKETSKQEKATLAQEKFDNIASEYDYGISGNEQKKTSINNKISLAETQGKRVSTAYYDGLISAESGEQQKLIQKRDALQKSLNEAVINGYVKEGSEEWYAMVDAINEVTNSIDESTKSLVQFHNEQRQIKWDAFDDALETVGRINSEADYYIDLMSNKDMVDKDSGKFTEYGTATLGLHQTNYENYLAQANAYQNEYNSLMDKIAKGEESIADENVIKRLRELQDGHRNAKLSAENELQAIQDLVKQGYESQLDILSKLIDKYKKLKDSELDAYKYQKEIAEKTKNIAALQKQLSAYGNNDTEEARAQIQKLKVELQDAQNDLKDTEYEKFISDTETMLDDLFNDYEAFIDDKINSTDTLLTDIKTLLGGENGSIISILKALDPNLTQTLENTVNGNTNAQDYTNNEVANEQANVNQPVDNSGYDAEEEARKQKQAEEEKKIREQNERKRSMILSSIDIVKKQIAELEQELANIDKEEEDYKKAVKNKKNKNKFIAKRDWASLRKTINKRLNESNKQLEDLNSQLASIPQYEKGSSHISKKQLAWTQENGNEMIYRASDGAMLTPLNVGDKVFTNEMSQRLWEMAQTSSIPFNIDTKNIPTTLPILERNIGDSGDVNIDFGGITMYGVNDPETFGKQLREEICKNGRSTQCLVEAVSAKQLGKTGIGNARMYK